MMEDYGLVITGLLRNLSERSYLTKEGERKSQRVVILDCGRDYLDVVSVPKDEGDLLDALEGRKGETVSLDVRVGDFRNLWLVGIRG